MNKRFAKGGIWEIPPSLKEDPKIFWQYEVSYGEGRSCIVGGVDSQAQAFAQATSDASYYKALRPKKTVLIEVSKCCKPCNGAGIVPRKNRNGYTRVTCKACKGSPVFEKIGPFIYTLSHHVELVSDVGVVNDE